MHSGNERHVFLQLEIIFGIVIAYIPHQAGEHGHVGGQFAVLHIAPDEVAQDAAKIFVPWKREETPTVGQHPDEAGEQTEVA